MRKETITIIGAFGYRRQQIDGQTVKTRLFKDRLSALSNKKIEFCDTLDFRRNFLKLFFEVWSRFRNSSVVFILPGINGLKMLPVYLWWKKRYGNDLRCIAVGGWLPDLLKHDTKLKENMKHLSRVYVQALGMKNKLNALGLENVIVMPNSRYFEAKEYNIKQNYNENKPLRIVFFARVTPEKGIDLAIEAVKQINTEIQYPISLDVYGLIMDHYRSEFKKTIIEHSEFVKYLGILSPHAENLYDILSSYDCMVFPTIYPGEGFPGTIVDSFIAGLPVLVSDWKYNSEFIKHKKTGYLFKPKDLNGLKEAILFLHFNRDKIPFMRQACLEESKKYHSDQIIRQHFGDII